MLNLHRLRLLRELKHRETLAAVAAALSYSPSSISQQLSLLEAEVGLQLLEPVGRRVRLTAAAEILVAHTEALLERLELAEADLASSIGEVKGTLRVAAFQTAAFSLIPAALTLLRDVHPGLRVEVIQDEPEVTLPALLARDVDFVVTEEYPGYPQPRHPELQYEALCRDAMRLAQPTTASRGEKPSTVLRALAGRAWIMEPAGTAARQWAEALCRSEGFEPDVRFESSDPLVHVRYVEQGHAIALLPDLVWIGRLPTVELMPLARGRQLRRLFSVVRRGGGAHPAPKACRRALRQAATAARTASPLSAHPW